MDAGEESRRESDPERQDGSPRAARAPRINWDDSSLRSAYANVCNVSSTREEVVLLFGINQTWNDAGGEGEVTVQLTDRVILNPYVAKRLAALLAGVVADYESRFGPLELGDDRGETGPGGVCGEMPAPGAGSPETD